MSTVEQGPRLGIPLGISALVHASVLVLIVLARVPPRAPLPPMYRVNLVAAPKGEKAIGVVEPPAQQATPVAQTPATPPPKAAAATPNDMPAAPSKRVPKVKQAPTATPVTTTTPTREAPLARAGGGDVGGRGSDVANVRTEGIEFPYPAYLTNIVRQIALNFKPKNPPAGVRAEVFFLVQRDGTVTGIRLVQRSVSYAFDLEALGAVEAAASHRAFGPLPEGFSEPSLPVTFSFDPLRLR